MSEMDERRWESGEEDILFERISHHLSRLDRQRVARFREETNRLCDLFVNQSLPPPRLSEDEVEKIKAAFPALADKVDRTLTLADMLQHSRRRLKAPT